MILAQLFFRPALPAPLIPTTAIQAAPAAVASLAYPLSKAPRSTVSPLSLPVTGC